MHLTPLENFRKCVIASPPWVIFTISLAIMAFGVLVLACRLRNDSYEMQPSSATAQYCVIPNDKSKTNDQSVNSTANETGTILVIPVAVSMKSDFYYELTNHSSQSGKEIKWIGSLHDGQLGLRGADPNASLPFELLLSPTPIHTCADENCDLVLIQACATVHGVAEQHRKAHSALDSDLGPSVCDDPKQAAANSVFKAILLNRMDSSSPSPSPTDNGRKWCESGTIITMQKRGAHGLVLIPLLHDTVTARLHLLYTSYFLFTTILILIVYATCRKTTHPKQTIRTPESAYAKLSNERE